MQEEPIRRKILSACYDAWINSSLVYLDNLRHENNWDETELAKKVDDLENEGFIKSAGSGYVYEITSSGVIHAENLNLIPAEIRQTNERFRTEIIRVAAETYDQQGPNAYFSPEDLNVSDHRDLLLFSNLQVLEGMGFVKINGPFSYRITSYGRDEANKLRKRNQVAEEFEDISNLSPQARGRTFQKFLAKVIEQSGWSQEEGTKTSNEEMDVIVFRDREYYLIECKWEKDAIEASVIRELHGKLVNRIDVRGIVVSMSGFSAGAKKQAEDYVSTKLILLFGPADIASLISQSGTFDDLLNRKYHQLVTKRVAIFS